MVKPAFVPDAGDFVWLTFDPQAGREQAGRRPALVLSPKAYNARSGLASFITMMPLLPPNSKIVLPIRAATASATWRPTSVEPVKLTSGMRRS